MKEYLWQTDAIIELPDGVDPDEFLDHLAAEIISTTIKAGGRIGGDLGRLVEDDDDG